MNKKSQFFIISTVVMSFALTIVIIFLTIPQELTTTDLRSQTRDVFKMQELVSNFKIITNSLYKVWPFEQSMRTSFTIRNYKNTTLSNHDVIVEVDVSDYAVGETFELMSEESGRINAYYSRMNNNTVIIAFKDSFNALEEKEYFLYYNIMSDSVKTRSNFDKVSKYDETSSEITYESKFYKAVFNKSSGVLKDLVIKGSSDVSNGFYADVTRGGISYNQLNKVNADVNVVDFAHNELIINASLPLNTTYLTQMYHLNPNMIVLEQDFEINWYVSRLGDPGLENFNLSYVTGTNRESLAYKSFVNYSVSQPTEEVFNTNHYHSLFTDKYGCGLIHPGRSLTTFQTNPGLTTRVQVYNNTVPKGVTSQRIIINPFFNNHSHSVGTGLNYNLNPSSKERMLSRTEFITFLSQPLISSLRSSLNNLAFTVSHTTTLNPQVVVGSNTDASFTPFTFTANSLSGYDLNTVRVEDDNNLLLPSGVTTRNYHNDSRIPFYLRNNASRGVPSTSFELMNLKGEEFDITIHSRSETIDDDLVMKVYASNETLIHESTITPSSPGSVETNTFSINSYNVSGVYELKLEGDNVQFEPSTSLPLISVNGSFIINNTEEEVLFFQTSDDFSMETESSSSTRVALNNTRKTLFNQTSPISETVTHNYTTMIDYYLTVEAGVTLINTSLNIGAEDYYLNSEHDVEYVLFTPNLGTNHYIVNQSPAGFDKNIKYSNITYSDSLHELNNSLYEYDFDDDSFKYNASTNWFSSGDFYACIGDYGSCDKITQTFNFNEIVEDASLFKSASYYSDSINPVVTFYNDSNLIKMRLVNPDREHYTFGVNWMINGDDDLYYRTSSGTTRELNNEVTFNSTQLSSNEWGYVGKNDSVNVLGLFFKNTDVQQGEDVLRVSDDGFKISLNEYGTKSIYLYIGDSWNELNRVEHSLNSELEVYTKVIQYNYMFKGQRVESTGYLIG